MEPEMFLPSTIFGHMATPSHESSAFQMFIFYIYMLLFMFLLFLGNANICIHIYKHQ